MPTDTVVRARIDSETQGPRHGGAERDGPFGIGCDSPAH